jgi:hypothetical protein
LWRSKIRSLAQYKLGAMAYIVNTGHLPLSKNGRQHARASPGRSQPITWEASFVRGA